MLNMLRMLILRTPKVMDSLGKVKNEEFDFNNIDFYFKNKDQSSSYQVIADNTINDIDFQKLFSFVDRTTSKVGQQYLYNKLLIINRHPNFEEQENVINYFESNEEIKNSVRKELSVLNSENAYYLAHLFLNRLVNPPKWFGIIKLLSLLAIICAIGSLFTVKFLIVLVPIFGLNTILHYILKKYNYMYSNSMPQLAKLRKCVKKILQNEIPIGSTDDVQKSFKKLQKINLSIFILESNNSSEFALVIWALIEYIKILFLIEPIFVFKILKRLDQSKSDIQNLFEYVGKIDSALSISALRKSSPYFCIPTISTSRTDLSFGKIYHPLVSNCISNSLIVDHKSILLTGSNMSGKTTFIRSIAISTIFGQTINTCFADNYKMWPMKIFSSIRISDNVSESKSFYFQEVKTIKEMINCCEMEHSNLYLLDELFKGTNTIERIAAGKAVLSYMSKANIVFVSTHDIELTGLLKGGYELYHFSEVIQNDEVHFDYMLKTGSLKTRNAIKILEMNGFPQGVINEAIKISKQQVEYFECANLSTTTD
jgi:hypothetical protein